MDISPVVNQTLVKKNTKFSRTLFTRFVQVDKGYQDIRLQDCSWKYLLWGKDICVQKYKRTIQKDVWRKECISFLPFLYGSIVFLLICTYITFYISYILLHSLYYLHSIIYMIVYALIFITTCYINYLVQWWRAQKKECLVLIRFENVIVLVKIILTLLKQGI